MAAATEPGFTPNHLYRLLKAYETDPRTRSLLPKALLPTGGFAAVGPAFSRLSSGSGDFQALRWPATARLVTSGKTRPPETSLDGAPAGVLSAGTSKPIRLMVFA